MLHLKKREKRGATVQSWNQFSAREVLKRVFDANPKASREQLMLLVREPLSEHHWNSIFEYWFTNNLRSLLEEKPKPARKTESEVNEQRAAAEKLKTQFKTQIVAAVGLKFILPNGKMLKDCTGQECAQMGGQVGRWLQRIAAKIKPDDIVGEVLSEQQVRKLYGAS